MIHKETFQRLYGPNTRVLTVRIPETLYKEIARAAKKEAITLPEWVRQALSFPFLPSMLDRRLKFINSKYQGRRALEKVTPEQRVIDIVRMDLDQLDRMFQGIEKGASLLRRFRDSLGKLDVAFRKLKDKFREQARSKLEPPDLSLLNKAIIDKVGIAVFQEVAEEFGMKTEEDGSIVIKPQKGGATDSIEELANEIKETD